MFRPYKHRRSVMRKRCRGKSKNGTRCQNLSSGTIGFCRWHHPQGNERPPSGSAFEHDILKVLRLLGYRVERNVTVNGCQVDLLAEYWTGVISLRMMVECKDYGQRAVGIEEVNKFAGVLHAARGKAVDKG